MKLLQDKLTEEWVCVYCGYGTSKPVPVQRRGYETDESSMKARLQLLDRVAQQFGPEKVDEMLKDDPPLKELWRLQLVNDVAKQFGPDKAEALVGDDPEMKKEWAEVSDSETLKEVLDLDSGGAPSGLWYLVPIVFSLLGGLVAYVALRDRDENMAGKCLGLGIVVFILGVSLLWLVRF